MQIRYSDQAKKRKEDLLKQYAGISAYFDKVEELIAENPHYRVKEDMVLPKGKKVTCYKRQVRAELFSGLIPDPYFYLSLSYTVLETVLEEVVIIIIGVYLHNYTA